MLKYFETTIVLLLAELMEIEASSINTSTVISVGINDLISNLNPLFNGNIPLDLGDRLLNKHYTVKQLAEELYQYSMTTVNELWLAESVKELGLFLGDGNSNRKLRVDAIVEVTKITREQALHDRINKAAKASAYIERQRAA